jgi:hypothetical protein
VGGRDEEGMRREDDDDDEPLRREVCVCDRVLSLALRWRDEATGYGACERGASTVVLLLCIVEPEG